MSTSRRSTVSWADMFATPGPTDATLAMRVLKKCGEPFLILPISNTLAARGLALYPAQSALARTAKLGLHAALRLGLPLGLNRVEINFARHDAFPKFLAKLANAKDDVFPSLAILAGNPHAEGRRFIVLIFDETGEPSSVVKVGIGEVATRLIEREGSFLKSAPGSLTGLPQFRGAFSDDRVAAVALSYVAGDSPRGENRSLMGKLLEGWIDASQTVQAADLATWQTLTLQCAAQPLFARLSAKLAAIEFFPALYHGDFAPWNIKVSPRDGSWQVLDWERGERAGFPAWDWFHYTVQRGVLVENLTPDALIQQWENLIVSPEFKHYAARAGIVGNEKLLAVAYLFYCVEVLQQSEGTETVRALLARVTEKWI